MDLERLYRTYLKSTGVSTDTRSLEKGNLFFALKGENFDANHLASEALEKGAVAVVVDNPEVHQDGNPAFFLVEDSLQTLQSLAHHHREQLQVKAIALTGSNGKTTTKELLSRVLSTQYRVQSTLGNFNNHIGVPLTLLRLKSGTEIAVVEMGTNHFGEIDFLCRIAAPDYGYITNFGKAHLEGFGSPEGVVKAKSELYKYLREHGGMAFIRSGTRQEELTEGMQRQDISSDIRLISADPYVHINVQGVEIQSRLIGKYNYDNLTAAAGIGLYFGIEPENIKKAIESYVPDNKRSQVIQAGDTTIILDAYNANPTSMEAAIMSLSENSFSSKAVILGDMFELGEESRKEHESIARMAVDKIPEVFLIGENFYRTNAKAYKFRDFEAFQTAFPSLDWKGKTVLVKASRGMALERILELFK